ncbi:hypothetical protein ILYODFUR_019512 [Ilyodon furcidens]|uniref:Uncharacterized protein n=1 Tax=Ilyodon furcidens TaxID=33524 RepID=A0ABV0UWQ7_9TELE
MVPGKVPVEFTHEAASMETTGFVSSGVELCGPGTVNGKEAKEIQEKQVTPPKKNPDYYRKNPVNPVERQTNPPHQCSHTQHNHTFTGFSLPHLSENGLIFKLNKG